TDPNGVKVIQAERRAVEKPCGDYIFYSWPKPPGMKITPKLSYVRGLADWRWMIGCGVYLDDVEQLRAANHQRIVRDLTLKIAQIMVALVLMLTASLLVALYLSRRMGRQFDTITASFVKAGTNGEWIDEQSLRYTEFRLLAQAANRLTERRRSTDEALRQEKERLAVTLTSIGDGILVSDRQGTVAMMNRAAELLTGWDAATAIGRPLDEVLVLTSPDDPENRTHPARQAFETQRVVPFSPDLLLLSPSGEKRYVLGSSAPIRGEDSLPTGVVTVVSDISEQRRMNDEYLRFARLESVGLLAGGIAHDFNNILTVITGNASLIQARTPADSPLQPLLANIETASLRARDLTQQLLTFAKGGEPVRETADIRELLQESVTFSLRGSKVSFRLDIAQDLWSVRFDRGQMSQVIRNLVINAEQAMPTGGTITIAAENVQVDEGELLPLVPGPYITILIHDTGCGIPKEIQKRIFEPFFTTKE
ncbi:MAG TPA: cache domain-containing protein, partial [Candidatus Aminicenantes bacterium]|nr:cache domain-containing protein [Candidatus Aminicenantes bacterium]